MTTTENNWVKVYTTTDLQLAELLKAVLINEQIDAVVLNKKDTSYISFGYIELYVDAANEQLATEIIQNQANNNE